MTTWLSMQANHAWPKLCVVITSESGTHLKVRMKQRNACYDPPMLYQKMQHGAKANQLDSVVCPCRRTRRCFCVMNNDRD
jgi:glucan phosphoethanolaminetransferase (alkaline phosphatase superfamily)